MSFFPELIVKPSSFGRFSTSRLLDFIALYLLGLFPNEFPTSGRKPLDQADAKGAKNESDPRGRLRLLDGRIEHHSDHETHGHPIGSRFLSQIFYHVPDIPKGGFDIFGALRDLLHPILMQS